MAFIYNIPIKFNISNIPFRSTQVVQPPVIKPFENNELVTKPFEDKFGTKEQIEMCAKSSPEITAIMKEYNLPIKVNIEELEKLKKGHLTDCRVIAAKIYSALPADLKYEINLPRLQEAAMLHDYGKVLIPKNILNKNGKLNPEEKAIMELHPVLSYELLKNKKINQETLKLIKYHHQNMKNTGYPKIDDGFEYSLEAQILSAADKYSALREERSYKSALAKYEALEIMAKEVNEGHISQEVYTALTKII